MQGSIIFPLCRIMLDTEEKDTTKIRQYYLYTQRCVMFTATHTKSDRPVQIQSSMQDHNIHMYRVFTDTEEIQSQTHRHVDYGQIQSPKYFQGVERSTRRSFFQMMEKKCYTFWV